MGGKVLCRYGTLWDDDIGRAEISAVSLGILLSRPVGSDCTKDGFWWWVNDEYGWLWECGNERGPLTRRSISSKATGGEWSDRTDLLLPFKTPINRKR